MDTPVLETHNLTKRYGSLTAVKDLSITVCAGEVFGFLGPNGAGKTTAINMMCGLLQPDAGRVLVHGKPLLNGDNQARLRVGMCPQSIVLWERLTCLEQLQFIGQMYDLPGGTARRRGEQLLADLDLSEKRDRLARTLSGGMQRRLNLAMALVHDPEILVLDEPEAGLDPQSRVLVREYIQSLARKKTVILTTHNMDEAERVVDRVAIIDHGQLLVLDTPQALKRQMGEGDVIEVRPKNWDAVAAGGFEAVQSRLAGISANLVFDSSGQSILIRLPGAAAALPAVLEGLTAAGVQPGEVTMRTSTLEDVFIQLTGRRLRE